MHLTNYAINKGSENFVPPTGAAGPLPRTETTTATATAEDEEEDEDGDDGCAQAVGEEDEIHVHHVCHVFRGFIFVLTGFRLSPRPLEPPQGWHVLDGHGVLRASIRLRGMSVCLCFDRLFCRERRVLRSHVALSGKTGFGWPYVAVASAVRRYVDSTRRPLASRSVVVPSPNFPPLLSAPSSAATPIPGYDVKNS